MNNQFALEAMAFLQIMSFIIVYLEKDNLLKDWKGWAIDKKIGRTFFLFVPTLTILSLLYRPL